jgi:hypothetical protein
MGYVCVCVYTIFLSACWLLGTLTNSFTYCEQSCNKYGYTDISLVYSFILLHI